MDRRITEMRCEFRNVHNRIAYERLYLIDAHTRKVFHRAAAEPFGKNAFEQIVADVYGIADFVGTEHPKHIFHKIIERRFDDFVFVR